MNSLLSAVTGTTDETKSGLGTERGRGTDDDSDGGSGGLRRHLALAAAGLGALVFLQRRRARKRQARMSTSTTSGELNASNSARGEGGLSLRNRVVRTVASIAASVLVRRAIRRWRKR